MPNADVLVDLTPLDTSSRTTGTGRYIRALGQSLHELTPSERQGLDIRALVDLRGVEAEGPLTYSGGTREHDAGGELAWLAQRRRVLPGVLRGLRPRMFHATYHMGTPRGSFVPRVVTCLDLVRVILHEDYLQGRWIYRRVLLAAEALRFNTARRVQTISQHTADDLMRVCGVPASKIDVVLLGLDLERYRLFSEEEQPGVQQTRARYGLGEGDYFYYAGAADPRKNIDIMIAAFAKAKLDGASLVIVGKMREADQKAFSRALEAAGNPERVRFLGFVPDEDLPSIMAGALGTIFCSTYEGFGYVPVEAMACGCPVITTGLTSMKETVGDTGLIVPPRDIDATAAAIRRLATDSSLRRELSIAGHARAQRFSWKNTALATIDSYKKALRS